MRVRQVPIILTGLVLSSAAPAASLTTTMEITARVLASCTIGTDRQDTPTIACPRRTTFNIRLDESSSPVMTYTHHLQDQSTGDNTGVRIFTVEF